MNITARNPFSLSRVSWRETVALMAVAWLVPFLVHLVPWTGTRPLGVHLLPAFWTAFVAVYLFGGVTGLLIALVVPVTNLIATGLPALERTGLMTVELAAFVGFGALLVKHWPSLRLNAALAWVPARIVTILVQWAVPSFNYSRDPVEHFFGSMSSSLAGLGVLIAVNVALVALLPKDRDWDSP